MKKKQNVENVESEKDITPYKVSFFDRIPYWIKAIIIKYWMFGATYFFINMGLGNLIGNNMSAEYFILIDGAFAGILLEITNHIYHLLDSDKEESRHYVIFYSKRFYSVFVNVLYGLVWAACTLIITYFLRSWINDPTTMWFAEPFSFALVGLAVDSVFVFLKDIIVYSYRKVTHKEVI